MDEMIYVMIAIPVLLGIAFVVACSVPPLTPPERDLVLGMIRLPPPAPERGPETWEMTFFQTWPDQKEITLRQEFPAGLELREVSALWSLQMKGWSAIKIPRRVPPEDVE